MPNYDVLVIEPLHRGKKWIVKIPGFESGIHIADSLDEAIAYARVQAPAAEIRIKDLCGQFAHLPRA